MLTKSNIASKHAMPLLDQGVPLDHKKVILQQLLRDGSDKADDVLQSIFASAAASNGDALAEAKLRELSAVMEAMNEGLLRSAVFDRLLAEQNGIRRARLVMEDGSLGYTVVPDQQLASQLRCGDTVLIENQGRAVLDLDSGGSPAVGEIARLERWIGLERVEAMLRDLDAHVFRASARLQERLEHGEAEPGCQLLVNSRQGIAWDVLPDGADKTRYRFLCPSPVPEISVQRDIGNPPAYIGEIIEHIRSELWEPEYPRKYGLRRAQTRLLYGVSGTGKSLSIRAVERRMYEEMSEFTGVPLDELPRRVLRLRMPDIMNKYLGESDKNLDRLFDDAQRMAAEKFETPDGRQVELPVLVIGEEIDGLARARGQGDPIYDRIQTTALERLDTNCEQLAQSLVVFLFTTNVPQLVDAAFLRRAGGIAIRFGRLDRSGFVAVLTKQLRGLPFAVGKGQDADVRRALTEDVTDWFYSPNGQDPGQVRLNYVGSTNTDTKYRRDFLNGALVDRAVQQAAREACRAEQQGAPAGVHAGLLKSAFAAQVGAIVDQLTEFNVGEYVTLPEGARVAAVHRVEQPAVSPSELEQ